MAGLLPTLWHLPTSHYSEKVRWALDEKSVAYRLRAPLPGAHVVVARWLTRGQADTLPVLQWEGRTVSGSSAIVAAVEERITRLPLYPEDEAERGRALEIEKHFDTEVAPAVRLLVFHELAREPKQLAEFAAATALWPLSRLGRAAVPYAKTLLARRYKVTAASTEAAGKAREVVRSAIGRIEHQLGDDDYMVGGRFGIADLAAAALLYPVVRPAEGPFGRDLARPRGLDGLREELRERRGYVWVEEIYERHRLQRRLG